VGHYGAIDGAKVLAAFLGAPIVGLAVGAAAWASLRTQEVKREGGLTLYLEHLGPWHDAKAAISGIGGALTLASWAILVVLWLRGQG
jgi:hypothetical protein